MLAESAIRDLYNAAIFGNVAKLDTNDAGEYLDDIFREAVEAWRFEDRGYLGDSNPTPLCTTVDTLLKCHTVDKISLIQIGLDNIVRAQDILYSLVSSWNETEFEEDCSDAARQLLNNIPADAPIHIDKLFVKSFLDARFNLSCTLLPDVDDLAAALSAMFEKIAEDYAETRLADEQDLSRFLSSELLPAILPEYRDRYRDGPRAVLLKKMCDILDIKTAVNYIVGHSVEKHVEATSLLDDNAENGTEQSKEAIRIFFKEENPWLALVLSFRYDHLPTRKLLCDHLGEDVDLVTEMIEGTPEHMRVDMVGGRKENFCERIYELLRAGKESIAKWWLTKFPSQILQNAISNLNVEAVKLLIDNRLLGDGYDLNSLKELLAQSLESAMNSRKGRMQSATRSIIEDIHTSLCRTGIEAAVPRQRVTRRIERVYSDAEINTELNRISDKAKIIEGYLNGL